MTITTDLLSGIAAMLDAAGVVTYDTAPTVIPDDSAPPPIYLTAYPETSVPVAALTLYAAGGDWPTLPVSVYMLQVRTRSTKTDLTAADALDDRIADQLLGHYPVTLPTGTRVSIITRSSSSPIGRDAAGRVERTTNYRVVVHDPTTYR